MRWLGWIFKLPMGSVMNTSAKPLQLRGHLAIAVVWGLAASSFVCANSLAQEPSPRITSAVDNTDRVVIQGTHHPRAVPQYEAGRVPATTKLQGMTMVFSRSAAQEADLQSLLISQQDPASPQYHQWLTTEEFAARFGVADSDIGAVTEWLQRSGFTVEGVSRGRNRVTFSGTVAQVESAFGTELHYYKVGSQKHYAPATDISIPSAFSGLLQSVSNLSTFHPKSHVKRAAPQRAPKANFTSSQSGNHFLTPKDVATIYAINGAYNAGYTGTGQSIAVVGQSSVVVSDIEHFQSAAGLAIKDPTLILVPNSGAAAVSSGDEGESDLDLEYAGAIAKGSTIYFVYVGNSSNYSVWDALTYAVDSKTAPVISTSYGSCESDLPSSDYASLNAVLAQAASQGQTVVSAAGDSGSTDCYGATDLTTAQQEALAVDFPASSQYVTGMGGTEFLSADVSSTNTSYWQSSSGSDVISSALSYIPEQVWNDDSSSSGLSAGGGGTSSLTARPSWQTGVTGIPSGSYRLVPDLSLSASPNNAGYLYCSSDSSSTGVTGSCSNGFRDSNDTYLTVAGGTSFPAPIFAGMVAILNQKTNSTGLGVINSTIYKLAADASTYASAFHDTTSGSNACTAGSSYCSGASTSEYPATTGYDQASGLGSVNFYNLLAAWPVASSSSLTRSTTTLSAATSTPASGASDTITIRVSSASTSVTTSPTGSITISVDGATQSPTISLSNGSATYTFSSTTTGSHIITANYSGDATFAASTGSLTLTVAGTSGSFTLSATNITVAAGSSSSSTITITPKNGYTGTVAFTVSTSPPLSNACYVLSNATVSSASPVTTSITFYTSSASCTSGAIKGTSGKRTAISKVPTARNDTPQASSLNISQASIALAALIFFGFLGGRLRKTVVLNGVLVLGAFIFAAAGCASGGTTSTSSIKATKGTYTVTIVGTDILSSSITASTTMTLTID